MSAQTRTLLGAGPWCAQCRAGGSQIEADWFVEGKAALVNQSRPMPYRGFLCHEHKTMFDMDGAKWKRWQRLSSN